MDDYEARRAAADAEMAKMTPAESQMILLVQAVMWDGVESDPVRRDSTKMLLPC